jgi:hypothetical protein
MVGSGVPAAAIFYENLADADDAALMLLRFALINIFLKFGHFGSPLCITMTILNFQE